MTTDSCRVLAIESSCDETALAVVGAAISPCRESSGGSTPDVTFVVEGEVLATQVALHATYGGVVPELAAREHMKSLPLLLDRLIQSSVSDGFSRDENHFFSELDAVVVTRGPGLMGCLLMGYHFAHGLAHARELPLLGVNHIEGHVLAPVLDNEECRPPFLALVISGGHTELLYVRDFGEYELLGRTIDDAAGEAFDKSAHLLGFAYPGGPQLARVADRCPLPIKPLKRSYPLPKVMRGTNDFSFSGLKTAIRLLVERHAAELQEEEQAMMGGLDTLDSEGIRSKLCKVIQHSILETLHEKLANAVKATGVARVVVTGGVSANKALRARLAQEASWQVFFPEPGHSVDNAAMIGTAGALRYLAHNKVATNRVANSEATPTEAAADQVLSRWPVETMKRIEL